MYNDYYLQEINNKLATTNNNLSTIITNQGTIITKQESIIEDQETLYNNIFIVEMIAMLILLYLFVVRCMKN